MTAALREAVPKVSVNALAAPRVAELVAAADALRLGISASERGATLVDAGIAARGGLEAGRRIAEICMGGLGSVALVPGDGETGGLTQVHVHSADPVHRLPGEPVRRLEPRAWRGQGRVPGARVRTRPGDRPARAALRRAAATPTASIARCSCWKSTARRRNRSSTRSRAIARLPPDRITFMLTPTRSLAGTVQIVARALEVALHKAHALGFALDRIVDGVGVGAACRRLRPIS